MNTGELRKDGQTAYGSDTIINTDAAGLAAGIDLLDSTRVIATGLPQSIVINSAEGVGIIIFVAGQSLTVTLPTGMGWDGDFTPVFNEGKNYIIGHSYGTFYASKGRGA